MTSDAAPETGPEIVIALYRPLPGRDADLLALVEGHVPALVEAGLATSRPPVRARAKDGTVVEVFEWVSNAAAQRAHEHPVVSAIWEAMGKVATFVRLADLSEATTPFPHFLPLR